MNRSACGNVNVFYHELESLLSESPLSSPVTATQRRGDAGRELQYHEGDEIPLQVEYDYGMNAGQSDRTAKRPATDRWTAAIHDQFVDEHLAAASVRGDRTFAALRGKADSFEEWAAIHSCPCCREPVEDAGEGDSSRCCVVTLVSFEAMLNVHIPIGVCKFCQKESHASPITMGFFPSTLQQGLDLTTVPRGSAPIWFDMQLLDTIVALQARTAHTQVRCWL